MMIYRGHCVSGFVTNHQSVLRNVVTPQSFYRLLFLSRVNDDALTRSRDLLSFPPNTLN